MQVRYQAALHPERTRILQQCGDDGKTGSSLGRLAVASAPQNLQQVFQLHPHLADHLLRLRQVFLRFVT